MTEAEVRARVKRAVGDRRSLDGMRKSFGTILARQKENAGRVPDLEQRKERLRKVKESSVGNEALFTEAIATLRENGFRVVVAKSASSALKMVRDELKGYDLVVKSKSNVTKELHLAVELEKEGIRVIETDLGDRIVQLAGCQAAHPTGPACHLTRGQIAELFTKHFKKKVSDDPKALTSIMREEIASYIASARVGITGANAIAAAEGAAVIVHNEGNAAKCAMLPDKHLIITTPDKVVPNLDEAINVTKLQTYLSTGKVISSYINVITGPSYTADIEKQVYKGMHGPKEVLVIFVDDGRLDAVDKEAQYCIGCGQCLLFCPSYNVLGPTFGSAGHMGGQGVYLEGSKGNLEGAVDSGMFVCTSCGQCREVCPASIDVKKGIITSRTQWMDRGKKQPEERSSLFASMRNYDNPWQVPRKQKSKWAKGLGLKAKGETLFFAGCSTSLLFPESAKRAIRILRAIGAEPAYLADSERCCGATVGKLGDPRLSRQMAEECFDAFSKAGAKVVVTSCSGCSAALKQYPELEERNGIKIQHITQYLAERLDGLSLERTEVRGGVTFHDPCDLGRAQGVYEEPRRILASILANPLLEMERSRSNSACCGSGSGVKTVYPELANAIALDRVEMAKATGAKTLVTCCPWCEQSLKECQGSAPELEVVDLLELLEKSLR